MAHPYQPPREGVPPPPSRPSTARRPIRQGVALLLVAFVASALRSISFRPLFIAARDETSRVVQYATLVTVVIAVSIAISAVTLVALWRLTSAPETRPMSRVAMIMVFAGWAITGIQMFGIELLTVDQIDLFTKLSIFGGAVELAENALILVAAQRAAKCLAAEAPMLLIVLIAAALVVGFLSSSVDQGLRMILSTSDGGFFGFGAIRTHMGSLSRWSSHLSNVLFVVLFGGILIKSRASSRAARGPRT